MTSLLSEGSFLAAPVAPSSEGHAGGNGYIVQNNRELDLGGVLDCSSWQVKGGEGLFSGVCSPLTCRFLPDSSRFVCCAGNQEQGTLLSLGISAGSLHPFLQLLR